MQSCIMIYHPVWSVSGRAQCVKKNGTLRDGFPGAWEEIACSNLTYIPFVGWYSYWVQLVAKETGPQADVEAGAV